MFPGKKKRMEGKDDRKFLGIWASVVWFYVRVERMWKECMVFVGPTARKLSAHLCKESTTCAEMPKAPMLWVL